jgi:hypothetical protein
MRPVYSASMCMCASMCTCPSRHARPAALLPQVRRIEREAALGVCLDHPNIVATYAAFTTVSTARPPAKASASDASVRRRGAAAASSSSTAHLPLSSSPMGLGSGVFAQAVTPPGSTAREGWARTASGLGGAGAPAAAEPPCALLEGKETCRLASLGRLAQKRVPFAHPCAASDQAWSRP